MRSSDCLFLWLALSSCLFLQSIAASDTFYTAAVFEHARFGSENDSAHDIVETNLKFYEKATKIGKLKDADIIVFPEYGIFPPGDREQLKKYLENTPDPRNILTILCIDEGYSQKLILKTLSCLARNNSMFVVANTGDIQNCEGNPDCPSDGVFHFNTNLVFDRNGSLLVRYHKEHLFFEMGMDLAREQQNSTFRTDFGTFATYICFDIDFGRMSSVAQWPEVDGIAFSTMWLDILPQMASVQLWQSWSLANNATLLAANIQLPGYYAVGSGIFHGRRGAVAYTFDPDGISKLVVARVPRKKSDEDFPPMSSTTAITDTESWDWVDDGKNVPLECSEKVLNASTDIYKDYRCLEENTTDYALVKLTGESGHAEACHNGMCCSLDYSARTFTEQFYLGVYNGTYNSFDRYFWCEENCVLMRCDDFGDRPCVLFPMKSKTSFDYINLRANFSTGFVFPSVVGSGMRLVPLSEWTHDLYYESPFYESKVQFKSMSKRDISVVGLKGRCYERDPPYNR